jgi:hypothetical protein
LKAVQTEPLRWDELIVALREVRGEGRFGNAFGPDNLSTSIEVQGCHLRDAWGHEVPGPALNARVANLICDLVHFGDEVGLDVEGGVRMALEQYQASDQSTERLSA